MELRTPRVAVAGLSGDGGKTLVSLGLTGAFRARGLTVAPFKKGPDYIDAAWLAHAADTPCRNLDTFLMEDGAIGRAVEAAGHADLFLIEGNRGLFDGVDAAGSHSTARLAIRLGAPVLLVVDTTKATRTVAAMVLGCRKLEPKVDLAGVILNRVGTVRQEAVIRESVERASEVPVVGAIPRLPGDDPLPGRHLGLVTAAENPRRDEAIARAVQAVEAHVDLDRIVEIARSAPQVNLPVASPPEWRASVKVGFLSDEAFSFYYPENLEGLRASGAKLVAVPPRNDAVLGEIDGLYIGGGFPEVHVEELAANRAFASALQSRIADGLPIYAECGGLMYLSRELLVRGTSYPMAGALDLVVEHTGRPCGHGYEVATVDRGNEFFPRGTSLRGHEFHYSRVVAGVDTAASVLDVARGTGIGDGRDGIARGRVWASYMHLHALSTPGWADGFLDLAARYRDERRSLGAAWA